MTATNPRILLVEDDHNFGDVLSSYLEMNDFDITLAPDGSAGLEQFQKNAYDLCILDVMMPKKDGFTLAKEIRELNGEIPIIFLTAKSLKEDVIQGFKIGADDYIPKPFSSDELLCRIQAVLKRSKYNARPTDEPTTFVVGKYKFDYNLRQLEHADTSIKLSPKEAELLRLFCLHKNEIISRSDTLIKLWNEDTYFTARSMDVFITKLRKYLKDDPNIEIQNIHRNGFRLRVGE